LRVKSIFRARIAKRTALRRPAFPSKNLLDVDDLEADLKHAVTSQQMNGEEPYQRRMNKDVLWQGGESQEE
jgi:hypothetical protein